MKLVLATPLYPPDIAEPGPYIKELAARLKNAHEVRVVTYGYLPERIPGVQFYVVNKKRPLPIRLVLFTLALMRAGKGADVLYIQNGPSVELPVVVSTLFSRIPLFVRIGDPAAHAYAQTKLFRRFVERLVLKRARALVTDSPLPRPEILPFTERPVQALAHYEASWEEHLQKLTTLFAHA